MNPVRFILMAALSLSAGAAAQAQPARTVTVVLTSYGYTPSPITLTAGEPVRLLFQNRAGKGHDFTAKEFFAASKLLAGKAPGGKVNLDGGESTAIDLVPARGTYKAHCGKFMHSTLGMKSQIVVQ